MLHLVTLAFVDHEYATSSSCLYGGSRAFIRAKKRCSATALYSGKAGQMCVPSRSSFLFASRMKTLMLIIWSLGPGDFAGAAGGFFVCAETPDTATVNASTS